MMKEEHAFIQFGDTDLSSVDFHEGDKMTMEQWEELRLRNWLLKKHPAVLRLWEDHFSDLLDLDTWLEEYQGAIDQEFQCYLELGK